MSAQIWYVVTCICGHRNGAFTQDEAWSLHRSHKHPVGILVPNNGPYDTDSRMTASDRRSDAREAMADVVEQAAAMDGEP